MKNKSKLLLTAAAVTIIGGTMLASTPAFAQSSSVDDKPMSALVQKIADKFGLSKDEVQAVFDQSHQEMQAERTAQYEERLSKLVTDGKITAAQKQLILTKHQELQASRQSNFGAMKDKTAAERQAEMQTRKTELETWATQNGIDPSYLMIGQGRGKGGPRME